MNNTVNLMGLAALIRAYGKKVPGGYEVFIPRHIAAEIGPYATLEERQDMEGFYIRLNPNKTIDVPQPEAPAPEDPAPESLPEKQEGRE